VSLCCWTIDETPLSRKAAISKQRCCILCAASFIAIALCGRPAGGFYGRYLIVNGSEETVTELAIATRYNEVGVDSLDAGQGRLLRPLDHLMELTVSWKGQSDSRFKVSFSIKKEAGYRNSDDLYIELKQNGCLAWRLVEQPEKVEK
jgi:hypothetical protein